MQGLVRFPFRMTVRRTARGVVVGSPIEMDDALAAEIDALGPVRAIVAPNALPHVFLEGARRRRQLEFGRGSRGRRARSDARDRSRPRACRHPRA